GGARPLGATLEDDGDRTAESNRRTGAGLSGTGPSRDQRSGERQLDGPGGVFAPRPVRVLPAHGACGAGPLGPRSLLAGTPGSRRSLRPACVSVRPMQRPSRFEHFRYLGDRRTQIVYDLDADAPELEPLVAQLVAENRATCFGPDTLAEARNRGYRPHATARVSVDD